MGHRLVPMLDRLERVAATAPVRVGALVLALVVVYLQAHFFFLAESHEVDSYSYWFAAEAVARGADPYDTAALQRAGSSHELRLVRTDTQPPAIYPYVYPPPFAGVWRATLGLSPTTVHRGLELFGALMLGVSLLLLHRVAAPTRHGALWFLLFTLGLVVNGPAVSSTRLGQMNAPLLAGMLYATDAWRRGADLRSAGVLAAASLVKLSPALLVAGWGLAEPGRRLARYVALFAGALVGLAALTLPLAPWDQWQHFAAALGAGIPWRTEYSWWGWLTIRGERTHALLEYRVPLYLAGAGFLLACAWSHLRRLPRERFAVEGAAVGVVFMLLLSPLTWQHHYLFFLLPGYAWTTRAWAEDRRLVASVLAGLTGLVLLRLPGDWLLIRPVATLAAFLVWTFGSARAARLSSVVDREPQ